MAAGTIGAARTQADMYNQLGDDIGGALASVGGSAANVIKSNRDAKSAFEGTYRFLSERNMLSPDANNAIMGFVGKKDYAGANAIIAPLLAELDFGRKAMLSGRSGFFDSQGQWQMAMRPEAVEPRNKYGYRVGG